MRPSVCVKTEHVCPAANNALGSSPYLNARVVTQSSGVWVWPSSGSALQRNAIDPSGLAVFGVPVSKCNEPEDHPSPPPLLFPPCPALALQAKQPSQKLNTRQTAPQSLDCAGALRVFPPPAPARLRLSQFGVGAASHLADLFPSRVCRANTSLHMNYKAGERKPDAISMD